MFNPYVTPRGVAEVTGRRHYEDRYCPHCKSYSAIDNPVKPTTARTRQAPEDLHPFICCVCGHSFNAPMDTE